MGECEQFKEGSYLWKVCKGLAPIALWKTNVYRRKWGLPPLKEKPEGAEPPIPKREPGEPNYRPMKPSVSSHKKRRKLLRESLKRETRLENALKEVGITKSWVMDWLQRVGCAKRAEKKQLLNVWAREVEEGKFQNLEVAETELMEIME